VASPGAAGISRHHNVPARSAPTIVRPLGGRCSAQQRGLAVGPRAGRAGWSQRRELLVGGSCGATAPRDRRTELLVDDIDCWLVQRDGAQGPGVGRRAELFVGDAGRRGATAPRGRALVGAQSCWSATRAVGRRGATAPRGPGVGRRADLLVGASRGCDGAEGTGARTCWSTTRAVGRRGAEGPGDASRWPARRDGARGPGVGQRADLLVGDAGR